MRYRHLGRSGLVVSVVGLGCNNFGAKLDLAATRSVVDSALDEGITLLDTADSYGESEELLGRALEGRRDQVVLATKFGSDRRGVNGPDWSARGARRYVVRAVERSLQRLRTDWIDLYQLHWPDPATPLEETLAALTDLVHQGKVRYIGSSNFKAWQVADAAWISEERGLEPFISAQNHYNLLELGAEAELVPACEHFGVGILPYFPLASGLLTGKYHRGEPPPEGSRVRQWGLESQLTGAHFDIIDSISTFAAERSLSILEVAIGALAAKPAVGSVIAGATSKGQVIANARSAAWVPTPEDMRELDALISTPQLT